MITGDGSCAAPARGRPRHAGCVIRAPGPERSGPGAPPGPDMPLSSIKASTGPAWRHEGQADGRGRGLAGPVPADRDDGLGDHATRGPPDRVAGDRSGPHRPAAPCRPSPRRGADPVPRELCRRRRWRARGPGVTTAAAGRPVRSAYVAAMITAAVSVRASTKRRPAIAAAPTTSRFGPPPGRPNITLVPASASAATIAAAPAGAPLAVVGHMKSPRWIPAADCPLLADVGHSSGTSRPPSRTALHCRLARFWTRALGWKVRRTALEGPPHGAGRSAARRWKVRRTALEGPPHGLLAGEDGVEAQNR